MSPLRALLKGVLLAQRQASSRQWMLFGVIVGISVLIWLLVEAGMWPHNLHLPIGPLVRIFMH